MKRFFSVILAVILLVGAMPMTVFAAEADSLAGTGASYSLWLGTTQVTDANKNDILGDGGKAKFSPATSTLTLSNPVINGFYADDCKIYYSGKELTLKGDYHMPINGDSREKGIMISGGSLKLDGHFSFYGYEYGIWASKNITVISGSLSAQESSANDFSDNIVNAYFGMYCESGILRIESAVDCVDVYSGGTNWGATIGADYIEIGDGLSYSAPEGGYVDSLKLKMNEFTVFDGYTIYNSYGELPAHVVICKPGFRWSYDLWLGFTRVGYLNKDDIYGDGLARFDPETKTLTLNNPTITGCQVKDGETYKIYTENTKLTVKGSYHMTDMAFDNGIYSSGSLTLDGNFTFIADDGYAVGAYDDLNIQKETSYTLS